MLPAIRNGFVGGRFGLRSAEAALAFASTEVDSDSGLQPATSKAKSIINTAVVLSLLIVLILTFLKFALIRMSLCLFQHQESRTDIFGRYMRRHCEFDHLIAGSL
jgi:hypothetical protein